MAKRLNKEWFEAYTKLASIETGLNSKQLLTGVGQCAALARIRLRATLIFLGYENVDDYLPIRTSEAQRLESKEVQPLSYVLRVGGRDEPPGSAFLRVVADWADEFKKLAMAFEQMEQRLETNRLEAVTQAAKARQVANDIEAWHTRLEGFGRAP